MIRVFWFSVPSVRLLSIAESTAFEAAVRAYSWYPFQLKAPEITETKYCVYSSLFLFSLGWGEAIFFAAHFPWHSFENPLTVLLSPGIYIRIVRFQWKATVSGEREGIWIHCKVLIAFLQWFLAIHSIFTLLNLHLRRWFSWASLSAVRIYLRCAKFPLAQQSGRRSRAAGRWSEQGPQRATPRRART